MKTAKLPSEIRMLLVDDEPDFRDILAHSFRRKGYQVRCASSGREAFDLVQAESFDVVVSDIRMPDGDGIELLDRIRASNISVPTILLVTGFAELSTEDAMEKGAEALLNKPFRLSVLEDAVRRLLTPTETRWSEPPGAAESLLQVEIQFRTLPEAIQAKVINLGRGGMFLSIPPGELPDVDDVANFKLMFSGSPPLETLEGSGVVRWIRLQGSPPLLSGCGIEFTYLAPPDRERIQAYVDALKTKSYIPSR